MQTDCSLIPEIASLQWLLFFGVTFWFNILFKYKLISCLLAVYSAAFDIYFDVWNSLHVYIHEFINYLSFLKYIFSIFISLWMLLLWRYQQPLKKTFSPMSQWLHRNVSFLHVHLLFIVQSKVESFIMSSYYASLVWQSKCVGHSFLLASWLAGF